MANRIRQPVVAGAFYPGQPGALSESVIALLENTTISPDALPGSVGLVLPHAGYPYSGSTAACGLRHVAIRGRPETIVLLGANHSGLGAAVAVDRHNGWATPLGTVDVDLDLVDALTAAGLSIDEAPHAREHSLEVQLPFLQTLWPETPPIVPICVQSARHGELASAGAAIARAVADRSALIVASSDFTHYRPDAEARRIDRAAIGMILSNDGPGFLARCRDERLTICGAGAIATLMAATQHLGLDDVQLVGYSTSGEATGDFHAVVGYAAVLFTRRDDA